jgi:hypothetical protein
MQLFTGTRIAIVAAAAVLVAFLAIGASMGMFGDMFTPFFGTLGSAAGGGGTPAAGTPSAGARTGTPAAGAATSGARPSPTATVRR